MKFSAFALVLSFALFASATPVDVSENMTMVKRGGGFAATCSSIGVLVDAFTLCATCGNGAGGYNNSCLDLSKCVTNNGGQLACQVNGGVAGSCKANSINFSGAPTMSASCKNRSGKYVTSSVNLNDCIANYSGNLGCADASDPSIYDSFMIRSPVLMKYIDKVPTS